MKVLLIIPSLVLAGAETMCTSLAIGLKDSADVKVVSLYDNKTALSQRLEDNGIQVIYFDKKLGFDPAMVPKLKKVFDEEKPDVVHTHLDCLKYASVAAQLSGVPVRIHTVHNIAEKEAPSKVRKFNRLAFRKLGVTPVALSREVQESISREYGISLKDIPIVYNGVDLSKCVAKSSYTTDKLTFVHVGRFSEQKNHKMLIDAFKKFSDEYPNTELWLIGEGVLYDQIELRVRNLALTDKVRMWGLRNDVPDILSKADVFVLPSIYEGVPISIIEAMGTGLPVIATAVGGVPSMLDDDCGILIECNAEALVQAMHKVTDETSREKLGTNALRCAKEKFSIEIMTSEYIKIYKESML